jgi:hypothetical protein
LVTPIIEFDMDGSIEEEGVRKALRFVMVALGVLTITGNVASAHSPSDGGSG